MKWLISYVLISCPLILGKITRIYLRLMLTSCKFSYLQSNSGYSEKSHLDVFYDDLEDRLKPALEEWLGRNNVRRHRTYKSFLSVLFPGQQERNKIRQESAIFADSLDIEKYLRFWLNFNHGEAPTIEDLITPIPIDQNQEEVAVGTGFVNKKETQSNREH